MLIDPCAFVVLWFPPIGTSTQLVGQIISHYRVIKKLGGGSIGVVYMAEDVKVSRFIALLAHL